jgi:D-sedoheptulose 7-phosphate isomerase
MNGHEHLVALGGALEHLEDELPRLERWGRKLALVLLEGGRLLTVGNGGSAAQAQHLTAELVGRYMEDRPPFSGIALHADTSALTALVNDYGADEAYARAVRAHGRPGDILVALSTSGRSPNVLAATAAALSLRIHVFALTGSAPNPLADAADEAICVSGKTPTVQEVHQVIIHLLCEAFDSALLLPVAHADELNGAQL